MSTIRVRFAPSPTGCFHIGNARTALFNWLYARHTGGRFVLRIEDTDSERNTREALQLLLRGMRWLGLDWDEGPEVGGPCGPYYQSQRSDIYEDYLERLRTAGRAYEKDGAIYFRISGEPQENPDLVRGPVFRTEERDFVIFRSNGTPVYHFVVVVDDIEMGITHVIRGEDHLSNTSKHLELFKALGAELPQFAHIPLILKMDGPGKMSKRDEGALLEDYERRHFIAAAVRNYLCLLGWSPKDDREVLPIEEIIELFDFSGINRDNARFDERKLAFINSAYQRSLPVRTFAELACPLLQAAGLVGPTVDRAYVRDVLGLCQEKVRSLEGLAEYARYFFTDDYPVLEKARGRIFRKGDPVSRIRELLSAFKRVEPFSAEKLECIVQDRARAGDCYTGDYIHPLRFAVSGTNAGPGIYAMLHVLGRDRTTSRMERFVSAYESGKRGITKSGLESEIYGE